MTTEAIPTAAVRPKRRSPRWMKLLLVLSLAFNLLIVGIVVGGMIAVNRGGYWDAPAALQRVQRFMRGLPSERRAQIRGIFSEYRAQLAPSWAEVREARVRAGRLIERGGYTQEELSAAIDDLNTKESKARAANKLLVMAILAKLEPQERAHFLRIFIPYLNDLQGRPAPASRDGGVMGQGG
jgi:uncharacterized membrane protein